MVKYNYDAWGTISITQDIYSSDIGSLNPFRYKGYYYDGESGMYYCKTRYYVPLWGRWLNADSPSELNFEYVVSLNLFNYYLNDPIGKYDPTGNFAISLIFLIGSIVAGAIVGGVTSGIEAYSEGERGADLAMDAIGGMLFGATVGTTVALGGAAGLSAVAGSAVIGSASISIGSAIAISVGGMAIGSATKYSLDCAFSPREWSFSGYFTEMLQGGIQGLATFGLSYLGGKAGFFNNKIGNFATWDSFYTGFGGMNSLKMMSYISNLIFGPTISKGIFISGIGAIIRWALDKLFPEF